MGLARTAPPHLSCQLVPPGSDGEARAGQGGWALISSRGSRRRRTPVDTHHLRASDGAGRGGETPVSQPATSQSFREPRGERHARTPAPSCKARSRRGASAREQSTAAFASSVFRRRGRGRALAALAPRSGCWRAAAARCSKRDSWRSAATACSSCGRRSAACSRRTGSSSITPRSASSTATRSRRTVPLLLRAPASASPSPARSKSCPSPASRRWTAWRGRTSTCTSPWSPRRARRSTSGVRRTRAGTRRSRCGWCSTRTSKRSWPSSPRGRSSSSSSWCRRRRRERHGFTGTLSGGNANKEDLEFPRERHISNKGSIFL